MENREPTEQSETYMRLELYSFIIDLIIDFVTISGNYHDSQSVKDVSPV